MSNLPALRQVASHVKQVGHWFDRASHAIAPLQEGEIITPATLARAPILFGVWTAVALFGVFGLWAATAPIDSAAVASGQVVLDSNKKTIQHLEGGIVEEILVKEGAQVKAGEALVRLNATNSKSQLDQYKSNYLAAKATEARLFAERDTLSSITFPKDLTNLSQEPKVKEIMDNESRFFKTRQENLKGQVGILNQKIAQSRDEIRGLNAQVSAATNQISLLSEQIDVVEKLLAQGNALRPRLLGLKQQAEQLKGQRGSNQALIARAEQTITESQLSISTQKNDFLNKVNSDLQDIQLKISDLEERIRASADVVNRITIVSPIDGLVTGLAVHTVGGVIKPGEAIMDIVPTNDKLIVEAQVMPQDIDVVHAGLIARIQLTAYKSRNVPNIKGKVLNVSADKFVDQRTGNSYFIARIEADPDELKQLKDVELSPGMPAQVLIVTGERTLLRYLLGPLNDALTHSFREQ